ncbi:hypothetical protein [Xylophilus sp. GOD-11R]|uniref:hypothetical protein n=1 Tax=Xylophilus sp. GOD-11R TaxID=3089814 RepID=UPI00298CC8DB|nr:hypothetical protein [Xylophilus sp. GOD-11R]WPB56207.1 hypothetical protein R9X41_18990 [Xylophilus sp. GOD-11R]
MRYRIDGEPWVVSGIYTDELLNRSKVGRMGRLIDWMLNEKIKLELRGAGAPVG